MTVRKVEVADATESLATYVRVGEGAGGQGSWGAGDRSSVPTLLPFGPASATETRSSSPRSLSRDS